MTLDNVGDITRGFEHLIERYNKFRIQKGIKEFEQLSEANVRKDFINPLFEILGWSVQDSREYDAEMSVRGAGYVDITLKIRGTPVIFVEAKRFGGIPSRDDRGVQTTLEGLKIHADWTEEERQVLNYAGMSVGVKWAVLTNFEKFRLFNAKTGQVLLSIESPHEYLERIQDIILLSRHNVENGTINKIEERIERPNIDLAFLRLLNDWRIKLARNIDKNVPGLTLTEVKRYVQRLLDRLIIIRFAEDNWVLDDPDLLKSAHGHWLRTRTYSDLSQILSDLFLGIDKILDSKIFEKDDKFDRVFAKVDTKVLGEIIEALYQQSFRKFTSDILGNTYESYLAHKLDRKPNGELVLMLDQRIRKAGGIYYTPTYIVEYIISKTLGVQLGSLWKKVEELFNERQYEEAQSEFQKIANIRVLDSACGSGSFLIKAFDHFLIYYLKYNRKVEEINDGIRKRIQKLRSSGDRQAAWDLESRRLNRIEGYEKRILEENLFGVDLDPPACEIASVNLMLRALRKGEKLPLILEDTIRIGNSLVSGAEEELIRYFQKPSKLLPFNWEDEFKGVFSEGGFDIVVANPPWIQSKFLDKTEKRYFRDNFVSMKKQYDLFNGFVERGIEVLKPGGILGFIMPSRFLMNHDYEPFRKFLLDNCSIIEICDVGEGIFEGVTMPALIAILRKESNPKQRADSRIDIKVEVKDLRQGVLRHYRVPQKRFLMEEGHLFTIYLTNTLNKIIRKMEKESVLFGDLVDNARGVEIGKRSPLVSETHKRGYVPFLVGENIDRYAILGHRYLKLGEENIDYKSPQLYSAEKILVRKTGTGIRATYDDSGYYVIQVIYIFTKKSPRVNLKYLTGLLNSRLLGFYNYGKFGERYKTTFPHLRQTYLLGLPIKGLPTRDPSKRKLHDELVECVDRLLELYREKNKIMKVICEKHRLEEEIEKTEAKANQIVYTIYGLSEDEITEVESFF